MEVEQKTPQILSKKLWNIMRIALSRSKLMLDLQIALQIMLKRAKLARKAISDLMLHHGGGGGGLYSVAARLTCRSNDAVVSFVGPHDYEFSCSNSPAAALFPSSNRRKRNHHKNRHGEIIAAVEASPLVALPGQFPLKDNLEGSSQIDKDAEEFIKKFYTDLKKQRRIEELQPPSPFHIWAY